MTNEIQKMSEEEFYPSEDEPYRVRPWVRFWARSIDIFLFGSLFVWALASAFPSFFSEYGNKYIVSIFAYVIWAFFEAIFISKGGCTPGKWLLNTRVQNADGSNLSYMKALKRVFLVLFYGEGLRIPLASLIMRIISYKRLVEQGATKWDEKEGVYVSHKQLDIAKIVIAAVLFIVLPVVFYCVSEMIMNYRYM